MVAISHSGHPPDIPEVETCPVPMTRSALLALRAAGELDRCAHYLLTDYNRANVGAAQILLHAVDGSTFSMHAHVKTSFDAEAWEGRYDIGTNRITMLADNLGNVVSGRYGNEVDRFPWGSSNVTETVIHGADVYLDAAPVVRLLRCRFESGAYVDLRGATGIVYRWAVAEQGTVYLGNATGLNLQGGRIDTRARLYGANSVGLRLIYFVQQSEGYLYAVGRTNFWAYYSRASEATRIYYYAGNRFRLYNSVFQSGGIARQYSGEIYLNRGEVSSYSEIRNERGAGVWNLTGLHAMSRSYLRNYATGSARSTYDTFTATGRGIWRGGSPQTRYNAVMALSTLEIRSPATIVQSGTFTSRSAFRATGGSHYRPHLAGYFILNAGFNTRSVVCHGRITKTLTAANTNRGRNYFNDTLI